MSAIANITIADGAATPVSHVFVPVSSNPASWEDTDSAKVYKASQNRIQTTTKRSASTKGLTRVKAVVELPTMGNGVSLPASEVDYTETVIIEFISPNRGLEIERTNARVFTKNLLADPQFIDIIDKLRSSY